MEAGETVRVVGRPSMEPSTRRPFMTIVWKHSKLGVPLQRLEPVEASRDTEQTLADFHTWLDH